MTPLILPDIHEKLSNDVVAGRPPAVFQVLVSVLPNGFIVTDFAGVCSRADINRAMVTSHQDLIEIVRASEKARHGEKPGIAIVTDPDAIKKLNEARG